MAVSGHQTGMTGVYLVAATLSRQGFIVAPTLRSAKGADLLATSQSCSHAFSVQVKTNASNFSCWLLNEDAKSMVSGSHFYVLVNLRKDYEFYIVPSLVVSEKMDVENQKGRTWRSFSIANAKEYRDQWDLLGSPK